MRKALFALLLGAALPTLADEGMWTFDNFPATAVKEKYGATIDGAWLDRVRRSTIRLSNCTASFVSPDGLILTNHHCVEACLAELSSKEASYVQTGFVSRNRREELRCATQVADVLQAMEDITARVTAAAAGLDQAAANDARKQALTRLEQACEQESKLKCESVTLYQGGQYFLYKYKRYDDVRLVLAPEADIASFGGDPDNFQFPRWSLDFSLLRAYENGRPAKTPDHLPIRFAGPQAGELVFVSGHPGSTARLETRAELEFQRDVAWPNWLLRYSELRGRYIEFGKTGEAAARIVEAPLNSLENGIKVRRKLLDALHEDALLAGKGAAEEALRAKMAGDPTFGDPWADIARATGIERGLYLPYLFLEGAGGFNSATFRYARTLVRAAAERGKPNTERLREYTEAALPRVAQQTLADVPVYPELENLTLSFSLERMREWLGPDHPVVRQLLAKDSPDGLAARLIAGTRLADPAVRQQLWDGGAAAIAASSDPMIQLALAIDAPSRAVRKRYEDEVEAPIAAASEKIAAARFKAYGTNVYPDATFTLRLNYGTVAGWNEAGRDIAPFTRLETAFARATGNTPFRIPDSWQQARASLDMQTPFCISTTSDIVGGNSGSALIDAQGRLVGLMFDGNIHSISGNYWFDNAKNRAIAVHPAIIRAALQDVYHADGVLRELGAR
ncbi:MAG: S46 family peptidase [Steroidobacteraceae bacterium]